MVYYSSNNTFKWLSPFNYQNKLATLCTQSNRQIIMHRSGVSLLYRLLRNDALCWPEIERYVPPRHIALVWFMKALQYCDMNNVLSWRKPRILYNRTFQILITRAAFALVCQQANDINLYGLVEYADLFRMLFEDNNTDRSIICQQIQSTNKDLFQRCIANKPGDKLLILNKMCSGHSMVRLIKTSTFFQRFARNCHTLHDFSINILPKYSSFGEALSNDIYFMNLLSGYLTSTINSDSRLLEIVLKTRFHLQLFSITAVKLQHQLDKINMCVKQREKQELILDNREDDDNSSISNDRNDFVYDNDESDNSEFNHSSCEIAHSYTNLLIHERTSTEI
ncbi:unnamed protein product, partial [Acanthocheilonema viteae]